MPPPLPTGHYWTHCYIWLQCRTHSMVCLAYLHQHSPWFCTRGSMKDMHGCCLHHTSCPTLSMFAGDGKTCLAGSPATPATRRVVFYYHSHTHDTIAAGRSQCIAIAWWTRGRGLIQLATRAPFAPLLHYRVLRHCTPYDQRVIAVTGTCAATINMPRSIFACACRAF